MSTDWEKGLLNPNSTIRQALQILDLQASRIVLVVDEFKKLLGTVTDGDIRRGLLNNTSMDDSIEKVMNPNPITAQYGILQKKSDKIMMERSILSIPLVDDGVVKGLHYLNDRINKKNYENPVFLMAGGFGTRLRPLTDNCPKPLLKIGDKPILETIIKEIISYGFKNFYVSTHYMPEKIQQHFGNGEKWGVNISYIYEEKPLGTGGALGLLPSELNELPLIMMNGDILTNINFEKLLDFHNISNADATMCVREYEYQVPYGVVCSEGNRVLAMEEKPIQQFYVNAGIYVLNNSMVKSILKDEKVDMPTLLERKIANGGDVMMFPVHEYWLDIGRMDDFEKAQRDIRNIGFNHD